MAAPFWIHCNLCNEMFSKDSKHYLLSCTHIFCKTCMKGSGGGKTCPMCKSNIRFEDMSKLPDKLKKNFQPNIKNLLVEQEKVVEFQQTQVKNMAKVTRDYKRKNKQMMQVYEKEKAEALKLKAQLDAIVKQRRLMQEKLKAIYMRNQLKRNDQVYRNPTNSTLASDDFSSRTTHNSVRSTSTKQANSGFFDENSRVEQNFSSGSGDFFDKRPSNKRLKIIDHTQSDRTPFFA